MAPAKDNLSSIKPLLRALRLSLRYPYTVAATMVSTILIAALWGGNIGGLYPVLQVSMSGTSLQRWNAGEIEKARKALTTIEDEIAAVERNLKDKSVTLPARIKLRRQLSMLEVKLPVAEAELYSQRKIRPWITSYLPDDPFQTIVVFLCVLSCAFVVRQFCQLVSTLLQARMSALISIQLKKRFFNWMLRSDQATFNNKGASGITAHTGDIASVTNGITVILESAVREPAKMAACLIGASLISWRLLLFSLIVAPVAVVFIRMLGKLLRRFTQKTFAIGRDLNKVVYDVLDGLPVVQLYTAQEIEKKRYDSKMQESFNHGMKVAFFSSLTRPLTELLGMTAVCLALLGGSYLVLNEQTHIFGIRMSDRPLSLAAILVFYGLLVGINDPLRRLGTIYSSIQIAIAAANRLFPLLDQEPAITDRENALPAPSLSNVIRFENIVFRYQADVPVLDGINLEIFRGETIAVLGANGSGKSTLVNLLARFYDPQSGRVTIDGIDLRDIQLASLRSKVGYVTQAAVLFNDTVHNNIAYGNPAATRAHVIDAAKQAHADEFISTRLTNGYDTRLGDDGVKLSGGERQRLSLARAILRDSEVVILDEATSAIDPKSEQLIHHTLRGFLRQRTSILITHRLSTLDLADRIVVMEQGRIQSAGTHNELLATCPLYQNLRNSELKKPA